MSLTEPSTIIQIIPATGIKVVFKDDLGKEFKGDVHLIALDDKGDILILQFDETGFADEPKTACNFVKFEFHEYPEQVKG